MPVLSIPRRSNFRVSLISLLALYKVTRFLGMASMLFFVRWKRLEVLLELMACVSYSTTGISVISFVIWGSSVPPHLAWGLLHKRLDRAICNDNWVEKFPATWVLYLLKFGSDHRLILVHFGVIGPTHIGPKPFVSLCLD